MFQRFTSTPIDDVTTQVDVYFFTNELDDASLAVASVQYYKHDPQQSVEDFVAEKRDDLDARVPAIERLPLPEPGPPVRPELSTKQLVALLLEKEVITPQDVEEIPAIAVPIEEQTK